MFGSYKPKNTLSTFIFCALIPFTFWGCEYGGDDFSDLGEGSRHFANFAVESANLHSPNRDTNEASRGGAAPEAIDEPDRDNGAPLYPTGTYSVYNSANRYVEQYQDLGLAARLG